MKRKILMMLSFVLVLSMIFSFTFTGCREEAVSEEEAVEEAAPVEEAVSEEEAVEEAAPAEEAIEEEILLTWEGFGNPDLEAKLTFWSWFNAVPKAIYEDFSKLYPKVEIEFVDMGYGDMHTKLYNTFISGTGGPDIVTIADDLAQRFMKSGLSDLTEKMQPYQELVTEMKYNKVSRSSDGTVFGVPWDAGPVVLFYRADLFEQYGINVNDITTWDKYLEAGKEFVEKTNGEIKWHVGNTIEIPGVMFQLPRNFQQTFAINAGSGWVNSDGKVIIDNEDNIKGMQLAKDLFDAEILLDLQNAEQEGRSFNADENMVATWLGPCWLMYYFMGSYPDNSEGKWRIASLPSWEEGGPRGSNNGGTSAYITEQCADKEAAWEFLKFWLLTVDGRIKGYETGFCFEQVFTPAADDPFFQKPDDYFGEGWFETLYQSAIETPAYSECDFSTIATDIMFKNIPAILSGDISVEDGMKAIADEVRYSIAE